MNNKKTLLKMLCIISLSTPCFGMQARLSKTISSGAQNASKRITKEYQTFKAAPLKKQVTTVAHVGAKTAGVAGVIGGGYFAGQVYSHISAAKKLQEDDATVAKYKTMAEEYKAAVVKQRMAHEYFNMDFKLWHLKIWPLLLWDRLTKKNFVLAECLLARIAPYLQPGIQQKEKIITEHIQKMAHERGIDTKDITALITMPTESHHIVDNMIFVPVPFKESTSSYPDMLFDMLFGLPFNPNIKDEHLLTHEAIIHHELTHLKNKDALLLNCLEFSQQQNTQEPSLSYKVARFLAYQFVEWRADEGVPNKKELLQAAVDYDEKTENMKKILAFMKLKKQCAGYLTAQQVQTALTIPGVFALIDLLDDPTHPPYAWRTARFHMRLQGLEHGKLSGLKDADTLLPMLN